VGKKVDIRKVDEKWSMFCFYGIFSIVVVFEIIAFESSCFCCNTQTFLNFLRKNRFFEHCSNFLAK
jgi:hypothetical protein